MSWRRAQANYPLPGESLATDLQNHLTTATNHVSANLRVFNEMDQRMQGEQVLAIAVDTKGQVLGYVILLKSGRKVLFPDVEDTNPIETAHCAFCYMGSNGIELTQLDIDQNIEFINRSRNSRTIKPTQVPQYPKWQFVAVPLITTKGSNLMGHSSVYPEPRRNEFVDVANRVYWNQTVPVLQELGVRGDQVNNKANELVVASY